MAFCRKVNLPALNTAEERGRGHRGTNVIIRKSIIARGRTKYERENSAKRNTTLNYEGK